MAFPPAEFSPSHPDARSLISLVDDLLCLCRQGRILWINEAGLRLLDLRPEDVIGLPFCHLLHPDHAQMEEGVPDRLAVMGGDISLMMRRKSGHPVATLCHAVITETGDVAIAARDLTGRMPPVDKLMHAVTRLEDRTRALARVSRQNDLWARIIENASEGILVLSEDLRVTTANPAFAEITGWNRDEVIGRPPGFLSSPDHTEQNDTRLIFDGARNFGRWQGDVWSWRKDGTRFAARLGVSVLADGAGTVTQFVMICSDITQRKLDEERNREQATIDTLTALPNRSLFLDRLDLAIRQAERHQRRMGLMFIDLDGFKLINDSLGHDIGDILLQQTARRLAACLRAGDTVARLGGDEFTILMPDLGDCRHAQIVATRILDTLGRPFLLAGHECYISASIGITIYPDDASDHATMLKNADAAMYRAKEQGKANFQFFTPDMNGEVEKKRQILSGLRSAIDSHALALYYQPRQNLISGDICGVEALLRWNDTPWGPVSPSYFIPLLEEAGLMARVGEWAIRTACRQARQWRDNDQPMPRIAVNLSLRQLRAPGFLDMVDQALAWSGISPQSLELEFTEDMIHRDADTTIAILRQLAHRGISLILDDFGTGPASLSVLKDYPISAIKIDGRFVATAPTDKDSAAIVQAIIAMGHTLGRHVIAEGVETQEQADLLRQWGCDEIQGFLLSPALPAADISRFLERIPPSSARPKE